MGYLERFKVYVKDNFKNGKSFSEKYGIDYSYYRKCTQPKRVRSLSRWIEMFVEGYELGVEVSKKSTATQCKCECGCGK